MEFRVALRRPQKSQASSFVEPCKSARLSNPKSNVRLTVALTIGICGFLWGCHRAVSDAIGFESVLWVTFDSRQESQMCLECTGIWESFEIVEWPLEFLSSIKWRPPRLEMRQEGLDSLPDEAGECILYSG